MYFKRLPVAHYAIYCSGHFLIYLQHILVSLRELGELMIMCKKKHTREGVLSYFVY